MFHFNSSYKLTDYQSKNPRHLSFYCFSWGWFLYIFSYFYFFELYFFLSRCLYFYNHCWCYIIILVLVASTNPASQRLLPSIRLQLNWWLKTKKIKMSADVSDGYRVASLSSQQPSFVRKETDSYEFL